MKNKSLTWKFVRTLGMAIFLIGITGCTSSVQATSSGVLSANQQRALNLATQRALVNAGLDTSYIGTGKIFIDFKNIGAADLGKQHVCGALRNELSGKGITVVDEKNQSDASLICNLYVAGADIQGGSIILFRWIDTKAQVDMGIRKTSDSIAPERRGSGLAKFSQVWFLGIGPSESLK